MSKIVLDTSVIIDYIDERGSAHVEASLIFNELSRGNIFSFITHPTLAETYYVSYRIYKKIGLKEPLKVAEKLVRWLYMHPSIEIIENTFDLLFSLLYFRMDTFRRTANLPAENPHTLVRGGCQYSMHITH